MTAERNADSVPREYCGVAEGACLNPAGYQVGGLGGPMGDNVDPPRTTVTCSWCGNPCCSACRVKVKGSWFCLHCDIPGRARPKEQNDGSVR